MFILGEIQAMNVNITHINGWSVWWFTGYFSVWSYLILSTLRYLCRLVGTLPAA